MFTINLTVKANELAAIVEVANAEGLRAFATPIRFTRTVKVRLVGEEAAARRAFALLAA